MSELRVYHGGTQRVEKPICKLGRRNLDFGQGFYLTDICSQAESWAVNMGRIRRCGAVVNCYLLDRDSILREACCRVFEAYDEEWLAFIIANRSGENVADKYDYVEGGVADDRVIDTVNLYLAGLLDLKGALRELSKHRPNNQICILSQKVADKYLKYESTYEL